MSNTRMFNVADRIFTITGVSKDDGYLQPISGKFEGKFQDFCRAFLEKDYVAIDIGANIGVTSLILSHFLNEGKIIAIEPGKKVFGLLQKNIADNGVRNVTPYNYAISDKAQSVIFLENSAWGHIVSPTGDVQPVSTAENSIMGLSVDDLVEKLDIKRLDFIKIDTEGFEPQVFAGAKKTIERFNPLIYFELNSWCIMGEGNNNPIEFMREITNTFKYIYRVSKDDNSAMILEQVHSTEPHRILVFENIARYGSVNDIVVTNDPAKMHVWAIEAAIKLDALQAEVDALRAEVRSVSSERDALRKEYKVIQSSRSYRYTSILRSIRKRFK